MPQNAVELEKDVKRLQRCMSDLVGLLALPAALSDCGPRVVLETSLDALLELVDLDFIYAQSTNASHDGPFELLKVSDASECRADAIGDALRQWSMEGIRYDPLGTPRSIGAREFVMLPLPLGIEGHFGGIVAGCQRKDFPKQTERLVLNVGINQIAILLQQAQLRDEQRRVTRELDERVGQKTQELTIAYERLEASGSESRLIVDNIPGLIALLSPSGDIDMANRQLLEYFGQTLEELRSWGTNGTIHQEDLPHVIDAFSQSIATGRPYETLQRYRRSDGIYHWFQNRGFPLRDLDGNVVRWCVLLTDIDGQKRAEHELKRSEERYRVVVETASDAVVSMDDRGTVIFANAATRNIFGYEAADLIGKPLTVLMPESAQAIHEVGYKRYLATSEKHVNWHGAEFTAKRANGEEFPVEVSFGEMTADGKRIFTGFIRDVTEKKRAEAAVRTSERNLRLIIDTMPVLAWSAWPDGRVDFFNQRWLDYTGLSPAEAKDWGWAHVFHPNDMERVSDYWQSTMITGESGEVEARIRQSNGTYRWFIIRAEPLRDESGAVVKWYGTNTDIEDRKQIEEELRRNEEFLKKAQRVSLTGCFSWYVDTDQVTSSEEALRIYGLEPAHPVTIQMLTNIIHPDDRTIFSEKVQRARVSSGDQDYGIRLQMSDGPIKYLRVSSQETTDASGRREHIGVIQDVTARHTVDEALDKARTELAHVSRITSLSALTASMAHEINQPLSGINTNANTFLRMLNADPPNLDGARETAKRAIRDSNRASDVIMRLRTLFSKKELMVEAVDLNDAALEVIALLQSELNRNGVMLHTEFADRLPIVTGDRIQLQQVVHNLIRNASDAMSGIGDRQRRLVIRTEHIDDNASLAVQDSGIGFDTTVGDRLFDSFYTTKPEGMGIGLSVSRSIIDAHHGRLWAAANVGPGSTFAFSIPCNSPQHSRSSRLLVST